MQPRPPADLGLQAVLVDEADVHDPLPARELDEHLLAVVGPPARKAVAPAGAGEGFPAVLGDERMVVATDADRGAAGCDGASIGRLRRPTSRRRT